MEENNRMENGDGVTRKGERRKGREERKIREKEEGGRD